MESQWYPDQGVETTKVAKDGLRELGSSAYKKPQINKV
jgi:hypothetical protein